MFFCAFGPRVCPGQNALRFWKEISYDEVFRGLVLDPEASFGDDNRLPWCFLPMEISFSNRTLHEDVHGSFGWALLTFVDYVKLAGVFFVGGRQSTCCQLQRDAWFGSIPTNMEIPSCAFG